MRGRGVARKPPRLAGWLLRRLSGSPAGDVETSLAELFRVRAERRGKLAARVWYWRQVLGFAFRWRSLRAGDTPTHRLERSSPGRQGSLSRVADCVADGLRGLRRAPGLSATVALTLGLGIGANTAVFSVVNAVLLNPLPYEGAERIFRIWLYLPDRGFNLGFPYEHAMTLRERSETLERIEILRAADGVLGEGTDALPVRVGRATIGLFDALQLPPRLGRGFASTDETAGAEAVVMLSESMWRERFGGAPDVAGRVLTLDGEPRVVVGVADASIHYLAAGVDAWVPMLEPPEGSGWLTVLAWRRPDVSVQQARAEMEVLAFEDERYGRTVARLLLPEDLVDDQTSAFLYATLAAVSLVLLIACVNVAHLMLTRGSARRAEIAVRAALGAGRRRLVAELLVESGALALAGGLLGVLFAFWCIDLLAALRPDSLRAAFDDVRLDGTVLGYAAALATFAGLLAGLAPAFHSWRWQPAEALRHGGSATVARGGGRLARQGLLIGEVALSMMLLIGAGLLVHSLVRLQRSDPGYDVRGLSSVPLHVAVGDNAGGQRLAQLHEQLLSALRGVGAVEAATLASTPPVHDLVLSGTFETEGTGEVLERVAGPLTFTAPGYFSAMGIPIIEGRDFDRSDIAAAETPVIVNHAFAERFFPGTSAVGRAFRRAQQESARWYRIVGVAGNAVQFDPLETEYDLQFYQPLWTFNLRPATAGGPPQPLRLSLLLRVPPGASPPFELVAERLGPLGAQLDLGQAGAVRDALRAALAGPRFNALLFAAFAAVALGLSSVGLYGVVSHFVQRRAREMGIRVAIGARAADVRRLVLVQGLAPVALGILVGLAGAAAAGRVIAGLLYLVEPLDPLVFALVPALLLLVAVAAIWVPIVRATRVDPVTVMRAE